VVMDTAVLGSTTTFGHGHVQSRRQLFGQGDAALPSHSSLPVTIPSPHVSRSQASPTPSPSTSDWAGLATSGQLSRWSGTPSPSVSGLAGTIAAVVHWAPGGHSASVTELPCCFSHVPIEQDAPGPQSLSVLQEYPAISTQRPDDTDTVPPVAPPSWRGLPVVPPPTLVIVVVVPTVWPPTCSMPKARITRSPAVVFSLRSLPPVMHPFVTSPRCAHSSVRKRTLCPETR